MKFSCDSCNAQYMIADEKVGGRGVKVKCKKCGNVIIVKPLAAQSTPEPTAADGVQTSGVAAPGRRQAKQEQAGQSQIGGAFDSLFGSAGAAGAPAGEDFGFGAAPAAAAPAPSSTPTGDKEWYVAVDDAQVGPVDLRDIEQRWDARELNEDSLAWKAGMPDWVPIAEIPELAYLITERPQVSASSPSMAAQSSAAAPQAGAGAARSSMAAAGGGGLGPVSFGGGGGETAPAVDWKPSAASALSSLVEEELTGSETKEPERLERPPAGVPELGMPGFGAGDLFGGGNGGTDMMGGGLGVPAPVGGGLSANWGIPQSRPSGGLKPVHVAIGGIGVVAVVAIAVLAAVMVLKQGAVGSTPLPTPQPHIAAPAHAPQPPVAAPAPALAPQLPVAAPAAPAVAAAKTKRERQRERREKKLTQATKPKPPPREEESEAPASAKATLSREDIFDGVKQNVKTVAPCLKTARAKNEISPGKYTFVLDWTIRPNGSVGNARLKGPESVLGSSLPHCFSAAMGRWRFPASRDGAPISNFPFGPVTVR